MTDEFSLIEHYFSRHIDKNIVGIGDDAAVIPINKDEQLLTCVDTMVEGVHFLKNDDPFALGYKLMAVNLSDIAAMGGVPKWATLSITLPKINNQWLRLFSDGLFSLADKYSVQLVGGDTTHGDLLVLSLQLMGSIPKNKAVLRKGAKVDDLIFVTGTLGGASFELFNKLHQQSTNHPHLDYPNPQTTTGIQLRSLATAMIDISDGLLQDLSHILKMSQVGAIIDANNIPFAKSIIDHPDKYQYAFCGGEDYQLLFTINKNDVNKLYACDIIVNEIGKVTEGENLQIINYSEQLNCQGFRHF